MKSLRKRDGIRAAIFSGLLAVAGVQAAHAAAPVIHVHNVNQLYAAINNPENNGVTVRLAPGTYVLSTMYPGGAIRPNRGALRMPRGMSLVGSEQRVDRNHDGVPDPISKDTPDVFTVAGTETVIDGSALDLPPEERRDCSGQIFPAPNPIIHVGVKNTVSHLTLLAGGHVGIGEPTNNPVDPNGNLSIKVLYTVLDAPTVAMTFANCECAARRARSVLTFSHNVVRGAGFLGLLIQNFLTGDASNDGSDGPAIWATLTSNLFYGNSKALQATAGERGTDGGSVALYLSGNMFRNNGQNFVGHGGVSHPPERSVANRLTLRSDSDTFGEAAGNLFLIAGISDTGDDPQHNVLAAEFLHSHFTRDSADTAEEISIVGGGGRHNRTQVLIRDATVRTSAGRAVQGGLVIQNQSTPGVGTSKARLEGSRSQFLHSNQGLPAPPARFFLQP